ncbi:adenosylcobinamide amidohydrolase [Gemmobacter serpentinus]|uniref:adenosylcobinamide amidohydrolase n=1 Tax=Gemmobacter serpentinus TaxID=2652247 RepID=UPI00124CB09C|nr:adenosylcobinamide amidohydrolase [Gemmobacter serpentinus]
MIAVTEDRPWLIADLGQPRRVLSFAPWRPGFQAASRIIWREVRNADLTPGFDAESWYADELARAGHLDAVGMLTSRNITKYELHLTEVEGIRATCLATVGLGNAERIGARLGRVLVDWGTINIAVLVDAPLTDAAMLEAFSLAAEARTAAVLSVGLATPKGLATGTGTDCIALAADAGSGAYAGKHTAIGEAVGQAVFAAVTGGAAGWMAENGHRLPPG